MSNVGLPDPLGLFGEKTDLLGRKQPQQQSGVLSEDLKTLIADKPTMPIADDEEVRKRKRRSYAQQRTRTGRASTIFTEGEGLGG